MAQSTTPQLLKLALFALCMAIIISGIHPYDQGTWLMEALPVIIVLPILVMTYRRFPLTPLLYFGIFLHALVLLLGAKYSYARVPLGFEIADLFTLTRNPYDKIGHFFQGLVPAIAAREILVRHRYVVGNAMRAFLVICIVLAISATYELIEWAAALALGQGAVEFLGTQGDPWDTQSDMFLALLGGITALIVFSSIHQRQIDRLNSQQPTT
jgi:putative membrane protein